MSLRRWSRVPADVTDGRNPITILTSTFTHTGLMHILAAWCSSGCLGPRSTVPNLGTRGAIAAVMSVLFAYCGLDHRGREMKS